MSLDAIKVLPVGQLARGDCLLPLDVWWAIATDRRRTLPRRGAFPDFRNHLAQDNGERKVRNGGGLPGPQYEPVLLCIAGNPIKPFPSLINGLAREHSQTRQVLSRCGQSNTARAMRRADLFSRENTEGFEAWGMKQESSINAQLRNITRCNLFQTPQTNQQLMLMISHASSLLKTSSIHKTARCEAYSRRPSRGAPSSREASNQGDQVRQERRDDPRSSARQFIALRLLGKPVEKSQIDMFDVLMGLAPEG